MTVFPIFLLSQPSERRTSMSEERSSYRFRHGALFLEFTPDTEQWGLVGHSSSLEITIKQCGSASGCVSSNLDVLPVSAIDEAIRVRGDQP